ncbi:MAG: VWA domain-containing protein [Myxococcales bacterium]|nr:VWA domain-containing protein [Myxococcales bacterium]
MRARPPGLGLSLGLDLGLGLTLTLSMLALAPACGGDDGGGGIDFVTATAGSGSDGSSGSGGDSSGTEADAETTATTAEDGESSESGSESGTTDPPPPSEPCTAVDLLFVVDNSAPMLEEQFRVQGTALAFVQQVQQAIPTLTEDVHVAVITTDDDRFVQPDDTGCGAPYEGGNPWMISSSTVLQAELECALALGEQGSPNERPMDMLLGSLSDDRLAPGGLHSGFLREDALLVVVVVTNEEDEPEPDTDWGSAGDPAGWAAALAERKGGYPGNVVVLSLLGTPKPNACPPFQWDGTLGAQLAERLIEFTESFPQGAVGDICAPEYATFMLGVVPGVAAACSAYTPP